MAMDLAVIIYEVSRQEPFARDYRFRNQIRDAAHSVPSNIAEGFERGTRGQFYHFLGIAKGSCAEVRSDIHLAERIGYIDSATKARLLTHAEKTAAKIGKLRATVAKQRGTPPMPHAACLMPDELCSSKT